MITHKVCTSCPEKGEQPIENFRKRKRTTTKGVSYMYCLAECKKCNVSYVKKRRERLDPQKESIRRKAYRKVYKNNNPDYIKNYYNQRRKYFIAAVMKWKAEHKEKVKYYNKKWLEKNIKSITDVYIKRTFYIKGLLAKDVSQELIELQREAILLYRQLKQINNGNIN